MVFNSHSGEWPIFNPFFFSEKKRSKRRICELASFVTRSASKLAWVFIANTAAQSCQAQMSKNDLGNGHAEFSDPATRTAIERSVFVNVIHQF